MTLLTVTPDTAGLTDVPGFEAAGVACDIRQKNDPKRLDLALFYSLRPCTAAGTFTIDQQNMQAPQVNFN